MTGIPAKRLNRLAAAGALAAAFSMAAVPASAAELPRPHGPAAVPVQAWDDGANTAHHSRWHRHRHDGIGAGDVLAGALIIGGIAAIAGAASSKADRNDRYDYPPPPPPQGRYDYPPPRAPGGYDYRDGASDGVPSGLDHAADMCADAVERSVDRVDSVDAVRRGPDGWTVDGTMQDGSPFTCTIDNNGRVSDVRTDRSYRGASYDGGSYQGDAYREDGGYGPDASYDPSYQDNQYDDETYARLRAQRGYPEPGYGG